MKIPTFFLGAILIIITSDCTVRKSAKKAFANSDFCYNHRPKDQASNRLHYDGYYTFRDFNCIFYNDGLWAGGYYKNWNYMRRRIPDKDLSGIYQWGVYKITGDTIKIRYLNAPQIPYDAWDAWYLIEDREHLNLLVDAPTQPITEWMLQLEQRKWPNGQKYIFVKDDSIPDLNISWFKNSEWLWCDKAAFKAWKAKQTNK